MTKAIEHEDLEEIKINEQCSNASSSKSSSILEFLSICGNLKHLKRQGWVEHNINEPESVASHMYRMAVTCLLISDESVDKNKCIKMALVHDLAEAFVGDLTPNSGISLDLKHSLEKDAIGKITRILGNPESQEILDLWNEYENGKTIEAITVKDIDRFDLLLQAYEYERNYDINLEQFFKSTSEFATDQFRHLRDEIIDRRSKGKGITSNEMKRIKTVLGTFQNLFWK